MYLVHITSSCYHGQDGKCKVLKYDFGQRALVGKVCMDRNNSVKHYKETSQESQEETCRFIAELLNKKYPRVKPVVTPRFAPSCTGALLGQLGAIAKNNNLHIQSHISENVEEVKLVKDMFPESESYTHIYHKYNLLTDKTVMAHGCYLSDEELNLFRETGASLSHCPNSNISLCSGILNVRNVLKHKVKLGLGTDVAGGYSASMLDAVRRALDSSKVLTIQDPEHETLTFEEVFRLATLGGSQGITLTTQYINNPAVTQKQRHCVELTTKKLVSPCLSLSLSQVSCLSWSVIANFKIVCDDRNIVEVFVAGRKVVPFTDKNE
uniref:Guanine deaminase n=1 Tax=Labrus bergylta TaxID=56723 RepID=A0A3Q3H412_9LABR